MSPIHKTESERISLRLAGEVDRHKVYEWLAHSDITASMMGPPDFPEVPVRSFEQFNEDYQHYYFDDTAPERGRCFIIVAGGEDVGVIIYRRAVPGRQLMELNIWLRSEDDCGRGIGSKALNELCVFLREHLGVVEFLIRPSRRNRRAIASCRKAGFEELSISREEQERRYGSPGYSDAVSMIKVMDE